MSSPSSKPTNEACGRTPTPSAGSELWILELELRGWRKSVYRDTWISPDGGFYRGPYKAWCIATGQGWPPNELARRS
jgi:hypothetical protein